MGTPVTELERWMRAPCEDEHLEFKEAKGNYDEKDVFRYCVALANEGGVDEALILFNRKCRFGSSRQETSQENGISYLIANVVLPVNHHGNS